MWHGGTRTKGTQPKLLAGRATPFPTHPPSPRTRNDVAAMQTPARVQLPLTRLGFFVRPASPNAVPDSLSPSNEPTRSVCTSMRYGVQYGIVESRLTNNSPTKFSIHHTHTHWHCSLTTTATTSSITTSTGCSYPFPPSSKHPTPTAHALQRKDPQPRAQDPPADHVKPWLTLPLNQSTALSRTDITSPTS